MITWLFTQVWLWSLAAFLLGAFVTWALFVRPLRRRLKAELARPVYAEPVYAEPVYDEPAYDEPVYDEQAYDEPVRQETERTEHVLDERQPAPLDLLDQPRPQWEEPAEHHVEDEWDRRPRPWVEPAAARAAAAETERFAEPEPEPEPEPQPEPEPEQQGSSGDNTWFRNPEIEETRADSRPSQYPPGADEEDSGQLSGQLRSLFEPESAAGAQEPYTPPVGADATQVIPTVPPAPSGNEANPLPKRTPQPRGESPQQVDPPQIPDALRQHVESGRPLPMSGNPEDSAEIRLVDNPEDSAPLPRRTPGAGPHPGRDAKWETPSEPQRQPEPQQAPETQRAPEPQKQAGSGPMIKGHSASRRYHTPDSPEYDRITADVWFRTPNDAEIAGFEPWHSPRP